MLRVCNVKSLQVVWHERTPLPRLSTGCGDRPGVRQQRIDLKALSQTASVDLSALEAGFATHAAAYSGRRGISHAAWREIGVSSATLKSAGIRRST